MTTMWKRGVGVAAGVALAIGATAAIHARGQGPGGGPRGEFGRRGPGGPGGAGMPGMRGPAGVVPALRALDLTEAQREQVKGVMDAHRVELEAQMQRLGPAREALQSTITAETLDEAAIRQRASELASIEADGAVLRAKVHAQVWGLLTAEQQQRARDLKAQRDQRRTQMRERMSQRRQQRRQR